MLSGVPPPRAPRETPGSAGPLTEAVFATSADAVVAIDATGRVTDWNLASERLFGWTAQEMIGSSLAERIIPAEFREAHVAGLARVVATGESRVCGRPLSLLAQHRDGRRLAVEITIWATPGIRESHFHAFARDVGAARQHELLLQRAVSRLERFAELLPGVALVLHRDAAAAAGYHCEWASPSWPPTWGPVPARIDLDAFAAAIGPSLGERRGLGEHLRTAEADMRPLDVVFVAAHREGARTRVRATPLRESGRLVWEVVAVDLGTPAG